MPDIQIVRDYFGIGQTEPDELEIPVAYKVEEVYKGTEAQDDPSTVTINERVKVTEDTGPFRVGDLLVLTPDEQREIEEEALQGKWQ